MLAKDSHFFVSDYRSPRRDRLENPAALRGDKRATAFRGWRRLEHVEFLSNMITSEKLYGRWRREDGSHRKHKKSHSRSLSQAKVHLSSCYTYLVKASGTPLGAFHVLRFLQKISWQTQRWLKGDWGFGGGVPTLTPKTSFKFGAISRCRSNLDQPSSLERSRKKSQSGLVKKFTSP